MQTCQTECDAVAELAYFQSAWNAAALFIRRNQHHSDLPQAPLPCESEAALCQLPDHALEAKRQQYSRDFWRTMERLPHSIQDDPFLARAFSCGQARPPAENPFEGRHKYQFTRQTLVGQLRFHEMQKRQQEAQQVRQLQQAAAGRKVSGAALATLLLPFKAPRKKDPCQTIADPPPQESGADDADAEVQPQPEAQPQPSSPAKPAAKKARASAKSKTAGGSPSASEGEGAPAAKPKAKVRTSFCLLGARSDSRQPGPKPGSCTFSACNCIGPAFLPPQREEQETPATDDEPQYIDCARDCNDEAVRRDPQRPPVALNRSPQGIIFKLCLETSPTFPRAEPVEDGVNSQDFKHFYTTGEGGVPLWTVIGRIAKENGIGLGIPALNQKIKAYNLQLSRTSRNKKHLTIKPAHLGLSDEQLKVGLRKLIDRAANVRSSTKWSGRTPVWPEWVVLGSTFADMLAGVNHATAEGEPDDGPDVDSELCVLTEDEPRDLAEAESQSKAAERKAPRTPANPPTPNSRKGALGFARAL
eukprot:tig00001372_g8456.t1